MKVYCDITEFIGNTPLLELKNIEKQFGLKAKILAKLEFLNPAGSAKDRVANYMIKELEESGKLNENSVIIEPTSGNTGIGLAAVAASKGYKVIIIMPDTMSIERIKLIKAFGAEIILTDGKKGMGGAVEKAQELAKENKNAFIAGQFYNPINPKAHYETTGPEIYRDTDGTVDIFVAGVGTGGTVSGTGKYLKEKKPEVQIVAVEPYESPLISKGVAGAHGIQGIGANFIPENYDSNVVDEIMAIKTEDSYEMGRLVGKTQGVLVGISSGAALKAAIELAKRKENEGKTIVALMPDTGDRYLSTPLFE